MFVGDCNNCCTKHDVQSTVFRASAHRLSQTTHGHLVHMAVHTTTVKILYMCGCAMGKNICDATIRCSKPHRCTCLCSRSAQSAGHRMPLDRPMPPARCKRGRGSAALCNFVSKPAGLPKLVHVHDPGPARLHRLLHPEKLDLEMTGPAKGASTVHPRLQRPTELQGHRLQSKPPAAALTLA